jgi:hypothetical protein
MALSIGMIPRHLLAGATVERHAPQIGQLASVKIAHLALAAARHM